MPARARVGTDELDKITGFLHDMEREWGKARVRQPLRNAIRKTLKGHRAPIRAATPVRTGALRRSVAISVRTTRRGTVQGGIGFRYRTGQNPRYNQIMGIEWGNDRTPQQRPLGKYWDRHGQQMLDEFTRNLDVEVSAQMARIAAERRIRRF